MQTRTFKTALMLLGLAASGALAAAPAAADCPYDLLAMCCTTMANGKCTRWQNCCFVWESAQPEGPSSPPAGPGSLAQRPRGGAPGEVTVTITITGVAEAACVRRCDGTSREAAAREACYGGCAVTPADPRWRTVIPAEPQATRTSPSLNPYVTTDGPRESQATARVAPRAAAPSRVGGLTAPAAPAGGTPSMKQLGSTLAQVPMKHSSCGLDCATHVLAQKTGNLDVSFKLEMSCPGGADVIHLSYQPAGHNATVVVGAPSGVSAFSQTIAAQPFTAAELEAACQQALGGSWPIPGGHGNTTATVQKGVHKSIEVWGQCSGWANKAKSTWPVTLSLTCQDRDFFVPEG